MTITLYTTADDNRKINKTVNKIKDISNISPTGNIDTYSPDFIIDYDVTCIPCNYLYCDTTGLYYFVSPPVLIDGRRMLLKCSCDYLMSFASGLMNCPVTVIRRENYKGQTGATYIEDSKLPIEKSRVYNWGERMTYTPNATTGNYFVAINGGV